MMTSRLVALGACALLVGACVSLLGDDFEIVTTAAGTTASGIVGGAGGSGGSAASGGQGATGGSGGGGGPASGTHRWSARFGDGADQQLLAVAADANGQVIVTGTFEGTLDFGVEQLSAYGTDAFVAKLSAEGQPVWARQFGAAGAIVEASAVAADPTGNIVVTGRYDGNVDFGGGPLGSDGYDAFVLKLTANGAFDEATSWGEPSGVGAPQSGRGVAIMPSGNIVVVGNYAYAIELQPGTSHSSAAALAIFVAVLDGDLHHVASESYGTMATNRVAGVAVDAQGIYLTGDFEHILGFGGTDHSTVGDFDIYVAKLDQAAAPLWSAAYGSVGNDGASGISHAPSGSALGIAGWVSGAVDFGGGALPHGGGADAFVTTFAGTGAHQSSVSAGAGAMQRATGIALRPDGQVFVAGRFTDSLDWGGEPLMAAGGQHDLFLAQLTEAGEHVFSRSFGSAADQTMPPHVAATPDGGVVIAGSCYGAIDFGGGPLADAGGSDIYVAKFDSYLPP